MNLITMRDLAERWGKSYGYVRLMRARGRLPEPDQIVAKSPVWYESTITELEDKNGHPGSTPETG